MHEQLSQIRTDLAIESAEVFSNRGGELSGITIDEFYNKEADVKVTKVCITNEEGKNKMGKPIGNYITLETPHLTEDDDDYHKEITEQLMAELKELVPDIKEKRVLVVGVGNRDITPDSLGPMVVDNLYITRHLIKEYGQNSELTKGMGIISAIAPGVMAQTGMEGREIIKGVIEETRPEMAIIIDALAARSINRLNTTIQLTDTGINPGSGVGNHRNALNKESLGIDVIAIGIPTVIDAPTIVNDTMNSLLAVLEENSLYKEALEATKDFDNQEKYLLMRELMEPLMTNMFVTPKDVDQSIRKISYTVSEAINSVCHMI